MGKSRLLPSETQVIESHERILNLGCASRVRKAISETFGFLDVDEQRSVFDYAIYEAYLVHRNRSVVRKEKPMDFEAFLMEFHVFSAGNQDSSEELGSESGD